MFQLLSINMPFCDVCGTEAACVRARIEGAVITVCDSCAALGTVVQSQSSHTPPQKSKRTHDSYQYSQPSYELREDFGEQLQQERRQKGHSIKQVANRLGEKASVIRRIEAQSLIPDDALVRKLHSYCSFHFYVEVPEQQKRKLKEEASLTIGDIARLKEK